VAACRDRVTDFLRSITADITELLIKPDRRTDHVFPFVLPQARGSLHNGVTQLDDGQIAMLDLKTGFETGGRSCRWIDSETGTTMNAVSSGNPRCTSWCMSRKAPSRALSTLAVSRWQRLGTPGH